MCVVVLLRAVAALFSTIDSDDDDSLICIKSVFQIQHFLKFKATTTRYIVHYYCEIARNIRTM